MNVLEFKARVSAAHMVGDVHRLASGEFANVAGTPRELLECLQCAEAKIVELSVSADGARGGRAAELEEAA